MPLSMIENGKTCEQDILTLFDFFLLIVKTIGSLFSSFIKTLSYMKVIFSHNLLVNIIIFLDRKINKH